MLDSLKSWKTKRDGPPLASGPNHVPVRVDISCRSGVQERPCGGRGRTQFDQRPFLIRRIGFKPRPKARKPILGGLVSRYVGRPRQGY